MTLEVVAEKIGLSASQISRFESEKRRPHADEVVKLAEILGVSATDIYPEFAEIQAADEAAKRGQERIGTFKAVPVRGYTQAGMWNEFENWEDDGHGEIAIPKVRGAWGGLEQFAFRVKGNSMDRARIFDGEFVVCVAYFEARDDLREGDIVVVERQRNSAVERTVKQIEIKGRKVHFCPRSTDPKFKPIVVEINGEMREADDTEVRIVGLVIGRWGQF